MATKKPKRPAKPDPLFIPDGETRTAFIKASSGDYPAIRFTYRRATAMMLPNLGAVFGERTEDQIRAMAGVLSEQIIGLCTVGDDHQNQPVDGDITAERLLTMSPFLFRRVQAIVTGLAASDPDPLDASVNGTAETDAKNSEAGCGSSSSTPGSQPGRAPSAPSSDSTKAPAAS